MPAGGARPAALCPAAFAVSLRRGVAAFAAVRPAACARTLTSHSPRTHRAVSARRRALAHPCGLQWPSRVPGRVGVRPLRGGSHFGSFRHAKGAPGRRIASLAFRDEPSCVLVGQTAAVGTPWGLESRDYELYSGFILFAIPTPVGSLLPAVGGSSAVSRVLSLVSCECCFTPSVGWLSHLFLALFGVQHLSMMCCVAPQCVLGYSGEDLFVCCPRAAPGGIFPPVSILCAS